ncbi:MAG TPA: cytochrome c biogenesis protein ResB [Prevotella sp.]
MWKKPYSYKEGTAIVLGLMVTGLLLQLVIGPLEWGIFVWPANIAVLGILVVSLLGMHILRTKSYFLRFITSVQAAVPAIVMTTILTVLMGIIRQSAEGTAPSDPIGLSKMLNNWSFILVYLWLTVIVGMVGLKQLSSFCWRKVPSFVSHVGLFLVLTCGTLGSADMQKLKMYCEMGKPEWRGLDMWNNVHELPIAIQLEKFTIDEYPPKLMVIDKQGVPLPKKKPITLLISEDFQTDDTLNGWNIRVERRIENAMPVSLARMIGKMPMGMMANVRMDSLGMASNKEGYVASDARGTAYALLVKATRGNETRKGWVTCGSYLFPFQSLPLHAGHRLVMARPEPRRYVSKIDIYTKDGVSEQAEVEVNKPYNIGKWKIYQLSFNEEMGKWSTYSVFELVTDPWLPAVYVGIYLLLVGAVGTFLMASSRRKETGK